MEFQNQGRVWVCVTLNLWVKVMVSLTLCTLTTETVGPLFQRLSICVTVVPLKQHGQFGWQITNKQLEKTQTEVKYLIVSTHWCLVLHIKLEKSLLDCLLVFSFLLCLFWFELLFLIFMLCAFLVQLLTQMTVMRA